MLKRSASSFVIPDTIARVIENYWLILRIAVIAILTVAIFFQDMYLVGAMAFGSNYYNFVLVIPFLSAYLIYRERKMLTDVMSIREESHPYRSNLVIGISSFLVGLIIYLYGSGTTYALDYQILSMLIFIASSILLFFNRRTIRLLSVPLLLFVATLPSITEFGLSFWRYMSWASTLPAQLILAHVFGLNVVISFPTANIPTLVLTTHSGATYSFAVAVASSGIYSVVGFTLFAAFLGYISKGSLWKKIALFLFAYPLLVLINIVREVILVSVANVWGYFAFQVFHATSGIVLVFIVTFILLVLGDGVLKLEFFPVQQTKRSCFMCGGEKTAGHLFCTNCGRHLKRSRFRISARDAYALAAVVLMSLVFLSSLFPPITAAYAPTNIPIQSISASNADAFLPNITGWHLTFIYRDTFVQQALEQDAALVYTYTQASNSSNPTTIFAIVQVMAGHHTPEDSLIVSPVLVGGGGVDVLASKSIDILNHPYLIGTFFAYQQSNSTAAYMYWITRASFNFGTYSDFRNVEISLWQESNSLVASGAIPNATDLAGIQRVYLPLAKDIAVYWRPVSSNSIILTIFQRWSLPLMGLAMMPAIIVEGNSFMGRRKETMSRLEILGKTLNPEAKELLISSKYAYREGWVKWLRSRPPSLEQILEVHMSRAGKSVSPVEAFKELTYMKHLGLVTTEVVTDEYGELVEVWKLCVQSDKLGKTES